MKLTKTRATLALGALLLAGIVPAAAQEPAGAASSSAAVPAQSATAAVPTGTRLRITVLPPGRQVSGTLASTTATGVTMNLDRGGMVTIPHATVRRYERDNGRSRKRGVLLGLLAGGVAGSLIGLSSGNGCTSQGGLGSLGCLGEPAASAAGGLLIGSGIGAAVGALLPPRPAMDDAAQSGGLERYAMMRSACAVLMLVIAAPSQAQTWRAAADEARHVTASRQVAASSHPPLRESGFFWTGLALIAGGGGMIFAASRARDTCNIPRPEPGCGAFQRAFRTAGGALIGSGGVVLGVGAWKRRAPSVAFTGRQVAVRFAF